MYVYLLISVVYLYQAQSGTPDLVRHGDIIRLEHKEYVFWLHKGA